MSVGTPNVQGDTSNVSVLEGGAFGATVGVNAAALAGFHGVAIAQGSAIAHATDAASAITQLNLLIDAIKAKGITA